MTPDARAVIMDLAQRMGGVYAPDLKSPYLAGSAGLTSAVLMMLAEESDRTAHRLVEENRAIRAIFREAAALSALEGLADRLTTLSNGDDADLHISALQADNDALRGALIDLHAHVEGEASELARAIDHAIWAELAASTGRRASRTAPF